jgi:hypothetical protein
VIRFLALRIEGKGSRFAVHGSRFVVEASGFGVNFWPFTVCHNQRRTANCEL